MGRPNFECGSCPWNLAYGEPETTEEQNHNILRHCIKCPLGDQTAEDKIAAALHSTVGLEDLDPRLYYKAAESLIAAGVTVLLVSVGRPLWIINQIKHWDAENKCWIVTSYEIQEVKVSMIQQKVDGTWKARISENGSVYDVPMSEITEAEGYYFTQAAAEKALEGYNETV